jgi:hypothetical protein
VSWAGAARGGGGVLEELVLYVGECFRGGGGCGRRGASCVDWVGGGAIGCVQAALATSDFPRRRPRRTMETRCRQSGSGQRTTESRPMPRLKLSASVLFSLGPTTRRSVKNKVVFGGGKTQSPTPSLMVAAARHCLFEPAINFAVPLSFAQSRADEELILGPLFFCPPAAKCAALVFAERFSCQG